MHKVTKNNPFSSFFDKKNVNLHRKTIAHTPNKTIYTNNLHNDPNIRDMYFNGIIIALATFATIGFWHPIVIKVEYRWGTRPWAVFLLVGLGCIAGALFIPNTILSAVCGVFGASALWGIGELFKQKRRVQKGWFPMNPKRKNEYLTNDDSSKTQE